MRRQVVTLGLVSLAVVSAARAQPMMGATGAGPGMPNLAGIVGRPLPDRGMPAGTVSVRVARKTPANAVADVEVSAVIKNAGGDLRKRTAKTDADGRALFEAVAAGDEFKATVTVDGEALATESFAIPGDGGIGTMLIAGLKAGDGAGAGGAAPGAAEGGGFTLGATAGNAFPEPSLPTGTLEVHLFDEKGAPIPTHAVVLGMVGKESKVDVRRGQSDAAGLARFSGLPGGEGTGYAAVVEWRGMRLGTMPFAMPESGGARAEIRALGRTADPKAITIGPGGRVVVQMHEDTLQLLEILPLENTSDQMFDPGPGAIEIPLPQGFVGAEGQEGEHKIEVRQNHGVAVHGAIPPKRSLVGANPREAGQEVEFGFVLPYHGDTREVAQPMPNGIGAFTLITQQISGLTVTGAGVGPREERQLGGRKYWIMPVEAVPAGGTLTFTLHGLPATDATGRIAAGVLALLLVGWAIAYGRRPPQAGRRGRPGADDRAHLIDRREALFAALVALEHEARAAGGGAPGERRKQLVGELEQVYRQLAKTDEQRAA
jgi:hypothetical protein